MTIELKQLLHETFKELELSHGFTIIEESDNGSGYVIKYQSRILALKLSLGHIKFSVALFRIESEDGVELFNLLDFLGCDISKRSSPEFSIFSKNPNEDQKQQLRTLGEVIYSNLDMINQFFNRPDINEKFAEIGQFMVNKYPNIFRAL
jgi:hypothetical protein